MELGIDIGGLNGVHQVTSHRDVRTICNGQVVRAVGPTDLPSSSRLLEIAPSTARCFITSINSSTSRYAARLFFSTEKGSLDGIFTPCSYPEFFAPKQPGFTGAMDAYASMGKLAGFDAPPKWTAGSKKPDWTQTDAVMRFDFLQFLSRQAILSLPFRKRCDSIVANTKRENIVIEDRTWSAFIENAGVELSRMLSRDG